MQSEVVKPGRIRRALRAFGWIGAAATAIAAVTTFVLATHLDSRIDEQVARNRYLEEEIAKLDKQIPEIARLREYIAALLARKQVVEALQPGRTVAAGLLDRLARLRGEQVVLRSIVRNGNTVTISGAGGTYLDVEAFIRRIGSSGFLEYPKLMEVRTPPASKSSADSVQFTLESSLKLDKQGLLDEKTAGTAAGAPK